uniref:Uncharacterized protein n=1 Tax=Anguilla anguilla TaxID=7936 RepID=A0A0E9TXV8_ANGAN
MCFAKCIWECTFKKYTSIPFRMSHREEEAEPSLGPINQRGKGRAFLIQGKDVL